MVWFLFCLLKHLLTQLGQQAPQWLLIMQVGNCNVHTDVSAVNGLLRFMMVSCEAKNEVRTVPGKGQVVY